MVNSNILRGPNFKSPTFEKELDETFLDEFLVTATERRFNDVYLVSIQTQFIIESNTLIRIEVFTAAGTFTVSAEVSTV